MASLAEKIAQKLKNQSSSEEAKKVNEKLIPFGKEKQKKTRVIGKCALAADMIDSFQTKLKSVLAEEIINPPVFSCLPGEEEEEETVYERLLLSEIVSKALFNISGLMAPDYRPTPPQTPALPSLGPSSIWYDTEGRPPPPKAANLPEIEQQPLWFDEEGRTVPRPPEKKLKLPQIEVEEWFELDVPEPPSIFLPLPPIEVEHWEDVEETINYVPPPPEIKLELPAIEVEEWFDVEEDMAGAPWPPLPMPSVEASTSWKGAKPAEEPEETIEGEEGKRIREKGKASNKVEIKKPAFKKQPTETKPQMNLTQTGNEKEGNLDEDQPTTASPMKKRMEIDTDFDNNDPIQNPYLSTPKKITQLTPKEPGLSKLGSSKNADGKRIVNLGNDSMISEASQNMEASPAKKRTEDLDRIQAARKPSIMKNLGAKHLERRKTNKEREAKETEEKGKSINLVETSSENKRDATPSKKGLEKTTKAQKLMEMENPSQFERERILNEGISQYEDESFPPDILSLLRNSQLAEENASWRDFSWMRLGEIFPLESMALGENIDPTGFCMNNMVNHYFSGALSALAEKPLRVKRLFGEQTPNKEGCYHVMLNIRGIWRAVVIDDFIPVIKETKDDDPEIAFLNPVHKGHSSKVDLWFLLIEKAWAKVFHRYEALEKGNTATLLRDLTGAPSLELNMEEIGSEELWNVIEEAFRKNYIVVAHKKDEESGESGIFAGSANETFTLLQAGNASDSKGIEHRVCRLRGHNSAYSVKKDIIDSSDMMAQLHSMYRKYKSDTSGGNQTDENISFCSFEEFKEEFNKLTICYYNEGYEYLSVAVRHHRRAFSIVQFTLEEFTQCSIESSQIDMMFFGESLQKKGFYNYSPTRIFIVKESNRRPETFKIVNCVFNPSSRNTLAQMDLKAGNYFAVVAVDWRDRIHDLVVNYYGSSKPTVFGRVPMSKHPNLLNSAFYHLVSKDGEKMEGSTANLVAKRFSVQELGISIASYENTSKKAVKVTQKVSKGTRWYWGGVALNERVGEESLEEREEINVEISPEGKRVMVGVWEEEEGVLGGILIHE